MAITLNGTSGITNTDNSTIPATATRSMVQLYQANGQGSTNTAIRRFSTTITNVGSDITYADSATLGASFTINTNGVYAINYSDQFNGAGQVGLSLNSSQGSTSIASITDTNRICITNTYTSNVNAIASATLYLPSGSVVRPHSIAGTANGSSPQLSTFLIVRVQ